MAKKSSSGYRLPPPHNGLNVNFCKNPKCANFGVPEIPNRGYRKKGTAPLPGYYIKVGKGRRPGGQPDPQLKCSICGDTQPIRNNASILEEMDRIGGYLTPTLETSCLNPLCTMHGVPVSQGGNNYVAFGSTAAGTPRWRCNACRKTFTVGGSPSRKHKMPHKNREVFMLLMNKVPINRISEITGLDNKSIYGKIDFIHKQCMRLAQNRESLLLGKFSLPKMYVAVDRQTHIVNWNSRKDRRNIALNAIGTADLTTGYVFGMHLNFDNSIDQDKLEELAQQAGDYATPEHYRKYARFWLRPDYEEAIKRGSTSKRGRIASATLEATGTDKLTADIIGQYTAASDRDDIENSSEMTVELMLPTKGVLIKQQYSIQAHFQLMARLLKNAPKVRFYLDQDSGFRAAFMSAFHDRIKARTADAWYVSILKGATIDQRDKSIGITQRRFKGMKATYPHLSDEEVKVMMVISEMNRAVSYGFFDDYWINHPLPNRSEPEKKMCWLTDTGTYSEEHAARLYLRASLHPIDRFFMQARRRLSFAERAYASASQMGRKWYGYNAYRPDNLAKLLDIFRVFYNYCLSGEDDKTPAMRLGLARGPVAPEDVLYFEPLATIRKPREKAKAEVKKVKPKTSLEDWLGENESGEPWKF